MFEPRVRALLRRAGVGYVLVPAMPRARDSGVARWLSPQHPLIQISLYGKTNDKFWFTFFHEAAHILLHAGDKKSVWLDDAAAGQITESAEREANAWSADKLIPPRYVPDFVSLHDTSSVYAFASKVGVHPGIVVGRLQHDRLIPFGRMNDLKATFKFVEASGA